jgi:hypothetical protein
MAWLLPVLNRAPAGAYRVISGTLIRSTQSVQFGFDWALMVAVAPEGKPRLDLPLMTNPGRPEPPLAGDETATLLGSLERERAILAWKCGGLNAAGLRARLASLASLVEFGYAPRSVLLGARRVIGCAAFP